MRQIFEVTPYQRSHNWNTFPVLTDEQNLFVVDPSGATRKADLPLLLVMLPSEEIFALSPEDTAVVHRIISNYLDGMPRFLRDVFKETVENTRTVLKTWKLFMDVSISHPEEMEMYGDDLKVRIPDEPEIVSELLISIQDCF